MFFLKIFEKSEKSPDFIQNLWFFKTIEEIKKSISRNGGRGDGTFDSGSLSRDLIFNNITIGETLMKKDHLTNYLLSFMVL